MPDVISSIGVLLGLILVKFFVLADAIVAILIGFYIIYQVFNIGKEITDSLLDVSNKDLEEKIKKIINEYKLSGPSFGLEIFQLKTRKIGGTNFAELKVKLNPGLKGYLL